MQTSLANQHASRLEALTHVSQQVSPLLVELTEGAHVIEPNSTSRQEVQSLYQYWKQHYPEAGAVYWQTRTWTMLVWQPITIALVTTYYAEHVPPISTMKQAVNLDNGVVGQFDFAEHNWQLGDQYQRLAIAAKELKLLIADLARQLSDVCRMSPATQEKLLADTVMEMLLRGLNHMVSVNLLTKEQLHPTFAHELQHWQQALELPLTRFGRLDVSIDGEYFVQRRACCMHYRRADGDYCQGCPQNK
ncbi:siderophore ferric iron reductase [Vibrio sp. CyArs1]|uniref:siderophore ferric iron reductase n=1 Tax=Vibrio sp. CyArs1 TaxID=2682577 RepID=UPI001F06C474|nr:siderophore ferric iron reductase [Vibrio sp. CyArs1]